MSEPTDPGIWADPEPKHKKPEEPIVVNVVNTATDKFEASMAALTALEEAFKGKVTTGFAGIHPGQKIGRITRNQGMIKGKSADFVVFDELESILGPQRKQEEPVVKPLAATINNLCKEVELPTRHMNPAEHMEFIKGMMSADAAAIKNLYYQKPALIGENPGEKESFIPRVVVQVEGRKPHIQQFVDIVRKTNGQEV